MKKPGKKPEKSDFTFKDCKLLNEDCISIKALLDEGFTTLMASTYYEEAEITAYSDCYFHEESYDKALEQWEGENKAFKEWLKTDKGLEFEKRKEEQKTLLDSMRKMQKEAKIKELEKELAKLKR